MSKLWEKSATKVESKIEAFTVGNDYILDRELLKYDCLGSIAHISMLNKIGIISEKEFGLLKKELIVILDRAGKNEFPISLSDEDCHTAIEAHLTEKLDTIGKKVHTGRSRNDQVLTALRLYEKDKLIEVNGLVLNIAAKFIDFAEKYEFVPLPGYTHYQRAMLSSVGMLFSSYAESLIDDSKLLINTYDIINVSPLGSAAGYGVSLPLDREYSAGLMGFKSPQNNVIYAQNSRGKFDLAILHVLSNLFLTLNKFCSDMILFSTKEFGFFSLPDSLTTGSSIMPQKKNPDVLELIRSKSNVINGYYNEISSIIRNLPSGYHRDYQLIKEPLINAFNTTIDSLIITHFVAEKFIVNEDNCLKGISKDIYAADIANEMAMRGTPFREAYKLAMDKIANTDINPVDNLKSKKHVGAPGNLRLPMIKTIINNAVSDGEKLKQKYHDSLTALIK
jgi:argininosuccinate lyase